MTIDTMAKPTTDTGFALLMTDKRGTIKQRVDITRGECDTLKRELAEMKPLRFETAGAQPEWLRTPDENKYAIISDERATRNQRTKITREEFDSLKLHLAGIRANVPPQELIGIKMDRVLGLIGLARLDHYLKREKEGTLSLVNESNARRAEPPLRRFETLKDELHKIAHDHQVEVNGL